MPRAGRPLQPPGVLPPLRQIGGDAQGNRFMANPRGAVRPGPGVGDPEGTRRSVLRKLDRRHLQAQLQTGRRGRHGGGEGQAAVPEPGRQEVLQTDLRDLLRRGGAEPLWRPHRLPPAGEPHGERVQAAVHGRVRLGEPQPPAPAQGREGFVELHLEADHGARRGPGEGPQSRRPGGDHEVDHPAKGEGRRLGRSEGDRRWHAVAQVRPPGALPEGLDLALRGGRETRPLLTQGDGDRHPAVGGEQAGCPLEGSGGRLRRSRGPPVEVGELLVRQVEAVGHQQDGVGPRGRLGGEEGQQLVELAPEPGRVRSAGRRRPAVRPVPLDPGGGREVGERPLQGPRLAGGGERRPGVGIRHHDFDAAQAGELRRTPGEGEAGIEDRPRARESAVDVDDDRPRQLARRHGDGLGAGDLARLALYQHLEVAGLERLFPQSFRQVDEDLPLADGEPLREPLGLGGEAGGGHRRQPEDDPDACAGHGRSPPVGGRANPVPRQAPRAGGKSRRRRRQEEGTPAYGKDYGPATGPGPPLRRRPSRGDPRPLPPGRQGGGGRRGSWPSWC
ncbi:MAG TPA: hypothetical protein VIA62_03770 [Thermoanaerobaculia bacterium]|nr:hypothetical protein [Thermoanaerobaculia bacterium]